MRSNYESNHKATYISDSEILTPKECAQLKRRCFLPRRDFRYGRCGGTSVHRNAPDPYRCGFFIGPQNWIECEVDQNILRDCHDRLQFISLPSKYTKLSLDKGKRWETYPEYLKAAEPSEIYHFAPEVVNKRTLCKKESTIYVFRGQENQELDDKDSDDNWSEDEEFDSFSTNYVKDRFAQRIYTHERQKEYWRCERRHPSKIKDPRIHKVRLSSPNASSGSNVHAASITYRLYGNFHHAVWIPKSDENSADYLEVDLLHECLVTAVGTKGRPAPAGKISYRHPHSRHTSKYVDCDQDNHWVTKYTLSFRSGQSGAPWIEVGEFRGNSDRCTEVAHRLDKFYRVNGENDRTLRGIVARYLRFRPLSREQHGFHGKKAMRVAVYGTPYLREKKQNQDSDETKQEDNAATQSACDLESPVPGVKVSIHSQPNADVINVHYGRERVHKGSIDGYKDDKRKRSRRYWKLFCRQEKERKSPDCFTLSIKNPSVLFSWRCFSKLKIMFSKA